VPVDTLAQLRVSNPGRGPHSIIGPIAVNGVEPGDVLEIRYQSIRPHRSMQNAADSRDVSVDVGRPDARQHLVDCVGVGEDVMAPSPVSEISPSPCTAWLSPV
jgi:hypothetical protein